MTERPIGDRNYEHGTARMLTIGEQYLLDFFDQKKLQELDYMLTLGGDLYLSAGNRDRAREFKTMAAKVITIERQMSGEGHIKAQWPGFEAQVQKVPTSKQSPNLAFYHYKERDGEQFFMSAAQNKLSAVTFYLTTGLDRVEGMPAFGKTKPGPEPKNPRPQERWSLAQFKWWIAEHGIFQPIDPTDPESPVGYDPTVHPWEVELPNGIIVGAIEV